MSKAIIALLALLSLATSATALASLRQQAPQKEDRQCEGWRYSYNGKVLHYEVKILDWDDFRHYALNFYGWMLRYNCDTTGLKYLAQILQDPKVPDFPKEKEEIDPTTPKVPEFPTGPIMPEIPAWK